MRLDVTRNIYLQEEDIWKSPHSVQEEVPSTSGVNMNTSNYLDHTPTNTISRITNNNWTDLPTMLTAMGLEKYISLFMSHEVDLATFPSLTDRDLIEMGITALGARRKMLLMISGKDFVFSCKELLKTKDTTSTTTY